MSKPGVAKWSNIIETRGIECFMCFTGHRLTVLHYAWSKAGTFAPCLAWAVLYDPCPWTRRLARCLLVLLAVIQGCLQSSSDECLMPTIGTHVLCESIVLGNLLPCNHKLRLCDWLPKATSKTHSKIIYTCNHTGLPVKFLLSPSKARFL